MCAASGRLAAASRRVATRSGRGAQSGLRSRIQGSEVAAMPRLAAAAKPVFRFSRSVVMARPLGLFSAISAVPSVDALSMTTTCAGDGLRASTAARQASRVSAWSWVTTTTA
jgi:hypothetical protein